MKKLLLVCLDGLGYSKISEKNTPFLNSFSKKNYFAKLKTLLSFVGIEHSFFKGEPPEKNQAFLDFKYSPETSCFKWQKYFKFLGKPLLSYITAIIQLLEGRNHLTGIHNLPFDKMQNFDVVSRESIWDFKILKNKRHLCYRWPLIVKNGKKRLKFKYESDIEKCKTLIKEISKDADIYVVQLVGLDKIAHKYGKDSVEYKYKIKELDKSAKFIYKKFKEKIPYLDIIFWSDHSFVNIKKIINIKKILPKSDDYLVFIGGTTLSFWFKNENIKKEIESILSNLKGGHILDKKDIKKYHIPIGRQNGELIFVLESGNYFFPNYYQGKKPYKAMHGYEPDRHDSEGVLITNLKLDKNSYEMWEVLNLIKPKK